MNIDERINVNALLRRANCPTLESFKKLDPVRFDDVRNGILRIVDEDYDSSMVDYVRDLTRTVIALADALERVLIDKEQLLKDVCRGIVCDCCVYGDLPMDDSICSACNGRNHFKWRGIPNEEDKHEASV